MTFRKPKRKPVVNVKFKKFGLTNPERYPAMTTSQKTVYAVKDLTIFFSSSRTFQRH